MLCIMYYVYQLSLLVPCSTIFCMLFVRTTCRRSIDDIQFGGGMGTSTTDALVEMIHHWCEATDRCWTYVRIVLQILLKRLI